MDLSASAAVAAHAERFVEVLQLLGRQPPFQRPRVFIELLRAGRASKRGEWDDSQTIFLRGGHDFGFDVPIDDVATVLRRDERAYVLGLRDPLRLDDLPGAEVRASDIADVAPTDQIVQCPHRLLDW